jgi:hypothetical protein
MSRRLLTTRRHVPLDTVDDYLDGWTTLQHEVERAGGRAWIFRGADHQDRFIEFIEWNDDGDGPLAIDAVAAAVSELDTFAVPGSSEEWEEPE